MRRRLDLLSDRRVSLPREDALAELRADIVRAAYVEGDFVLSSGLRRSYYFNKYLFETRPAILRRLGKFLADLVPQNTDRLAAPALGTVALGTAISLELGLPLVIVRVEDDTAPSRAIEGELYADESVALIEDVVVTGGRAMQAVDRVVRVGARVENIIAVLDRREGAAERFDEASIGYRFLFEPEDLGID